MGNHESSCPLQQLGGQVNSDEFYVQPQSNTHMG